MKTKKLIKRLASIFSEEESDQKLQLKNLKKLLAKLDEKEAKITLKLEAANEFGEEGEAYRKRLTDKLKVVRAQRAKGKALCEELAK